MLPKAFQDSLGNLFKLLHHHLGRIVNYTIDIQETLEVASNNSWYDFHHYSIGVTSSGIEENLRMMKTMLEYFKDDEDEYTADEATPGTAL